MLLFKFIISVSHFKRMMPFFKNSSMDGVEVGPSRNQATNLETIFLHSFHFGLAISVEVVPEKGVVIFGGGN